MDRITKALDRLSYKEKERLKKLLLQIKKGSFDNLDLKKLKGKENIFRVRKGNMRIIFHKIGDSIKIITLERRNSKTYKGKKDNVA